MSRPGGGVACFTSTASGQFVGTADDGALIGVHDPGEHVHPDERGSGHRGDSKCGEGIVAQNIDAEGQSGGITHDPRRQCHRGDRLRVGFVGAKRRVTEILDEQGGEPGAGQFPGIGHGRLEHFVDRSVEPG